MKIVALNADPSGSATLERGVTSQLAERHGDGVYSAEIVQDQAEIWAWMEQELAEYLGENPEYFEEHVNEDDPLEDVYDNDGSYYTVGEHLTVLSNCWGNKSHAKACGIFVLRMSEAGLLLAQQLACDIDLYASDRVNWEDDEREAWARCVIYVQDGGRLRRVRWNEVEP